MTAQTRLSNAAVERLIFHWPAVVRSAPKGWPADFAKSIAGQSRRRGWRPSQKQTEIMSRMVSDLFTHGQEQEGEFSVIER